MSWGGSQSCGFDLSSEIKHVKQCGTDCIYFISGWREADRCVHPKCKSKHNKRVLNPYYTYIICKEFEEKQ